MNKKFNHKNAARLANDISLIIDNEPTIESIAAITSVYGKIIGLCVKEQAWDAVINSFVVDVKRLAPNIKEKSGNKDNVSIIFEG
jgi:hypothetical protein